MSMSVIGTSLVPCSHLEFRGLHWTFRVLQGQSVLTYAVPMFGLIVVNGCSAISAFISVAAAMKVLFPDEGFPTQASFIVVFLWFCLLNYDGLWKAVV